MSVYDRGVDPLDELLDSVRVRRSMAGQSKVTAPWALAVDSPDPFRLVATVGGPGWLVRDGRPPARLADRAITVVADTGSVVIADDPATPPSVVIASADECFQPDTGENLADRDRIARRAWGDPDAATSVLVAGYEAHGERFTALSADLPTSITVADDPVVHSILTAVMAETVSDEPGQQTVLDRLIELLLFATVRAWLSEAPRPPAWYRALGDAQVGPALRAIHDEPGRHWSVADLAATTARSRAAFARSFREVVGRAPMAYVTHWRLACAADLLADGATVASVAARVGYTDAFAFSTAFRRRYGHPPSRHRPDHHDPPPSW